MAMTRAAKRRREAGEKSYPEKDDERLRKRARRDKDEDEDEDEEKEEGAGGDAMDLDEEEEEEEEEDDDGEGEEEKENDDEGREEEDDADDEEEEDGEEEFERGGYIPESLKRLKSYLSNHRRAGAYEKELMEEQRQGNLVQEFRHLDNDGEWLGANLLGQGGQGCTKLFVRLDEHQRVVERLALKELCPSVEKFNNPDRIWHSKEPDRPWWPREAYIHHLVTHEEGGATKTEGSDNIVQFYRHAVNRNRMTLRIYMEYMSWGDLDSITRAQLRGRMFERSAESAVPGAELEYYSEPERVPEEFIWYFLSQMATALIRMRNIPQHEGQEVVHQDIKPLNIFMGPPNPEEFPKYPVLKIGDFGSARLTHAEDPDNPSRFNDGLTRGYHAPEMVWQEPISHATNVWQIGQTAVTMTTLVRRPEQIEFSNARLGYEGHFMPQFEDMRSDYYSDDLLETLLECMRLEPQERLDPEVILERFNKYKENYIEMQDKESALDWENAHKWLHYTCEERFPIGTTVALSDE